MNYPALFVIGQAVQLASTSRNIYLLITIEIMEGYAFPSKYKKLHKNINCKKNILVAQPTPLFSSFNERGKLRPARKADMPIYK